MRDRGEASIALAVAGAIATASPVVVAGANALSNASGVAIFITAVIAAAGAIGTLVGKIWAKSKARDARDARVDRFLFGDEDNEGIGAQLDRIEARLLGTQAQTQDNSTRLNKLDGLEPS